MPTLPRLADLPALRDFPSLDFTRLDLRGIKLPEIKRPDVTSASIPRPELPAVDVDRAVGIARDAAYVGVGLTVLAVQQAQVRRRELQAGLERGIRGLSGRAEAAR